MASSFPLNLSLRLLQNPDLDGLVGVVGLVGLVGKVGVEGVFGGVGSVGLITDAAPLNGEPEEDGSPAICFVSEGKKKVNTNMNLQKKTIV